jgi:hypothetical protein
MENWEATGSDVRPAALGFKRKAAGERTPDRNVVSDLRRPEGAPQGRGFLAFRAAGKGLSNRPRHQAKRKSLARKLDALTSVSVITFAGSCVITVFAPTCVMSLCTAPKFANMA